jgi:hypothetical protein
VLTTRWKRTGPSTDEDSAKGSSRSARYEPLRFKSDWCIFAAVMEVRNTGEPVCVNTRKRPMYGEDTSRGDLRP